MPRVGVHAHVEGAGGAVAEAAGGVVDLGAGDADVGEHGVDFLDAGLGQHGRQRGEVVVEEGEASGGDRSQAGLGEGEVGGVEVDADQPAGGGDAAEQFGGVATEADGAVDDGVTGLGAKDAENGVEQDGEVPNVATAHGAAGPGVPFAPGRPSACGGGELACDPT